MTRAIIYTRYSPRRNADESESCEVQEGICRRHAESKGYAVAQVFHDPDISGADEYRQKLWEAIESLEPGSVLVVFKRDRLARNVFLAEQINRAVIKQGGRIEAVSGDIEGDGPEHVMVRQVLASIAEYERKMIGIRTSYAMKQHQRNGRRMGRYAPYGYELAPENPNQLVPVPSEQEAIELIREMADGGVRMIDIARRLNEEMPDACRGQVWRSKTIKKIVDRIG